MKRALAIVVFMSLLTALTGCITTQVKGYTDREYTGFRIGKVAVRAPNAGFAFGELVENSMVNAFRNRVSGYVPSHAGVDKRRSREGVDCNRL
jgi:hypothetical protein